MAERVDLEVANDPDCTEVETAWSCSVTDNRDWSLGFGTIPLLEPAIEIMTPPFTPRHITTLSPACVPRDAGANLVTYPAPLDFDAIRGTVTTILSLRRHHCATTEYFIPN